ncbi:hypothetical protein IMZ11_02645 [Microtetraspora sp. AC03309]|uniref:hypothetical protein n=1 Tax=Microtetraspora sp. AC03309 TaxID=2779376 RepID=UPI001E595AA7|nr:hypothetical protein [Microtetraspora sp. AC03309]MCC5574538.1 hypothetical protein [Microtetraspora sp. AC03309]
MPDTTVVLPADVADLVRRLAAHAECLTRAADDPVAVADVRVRSRLIAMADAARAGVAAALADIPEVQS